MGAARAAPPVPVAEGARRPRASSSGRNSTPAAPSAAEGSLASAALALGAGARRDRELAGRAGPDQGRDGPSSGASGWPGHTAGRDWPSGGQPTSWPLAWESAPG